MKTSTRIQLSVMMFLQYVIWGAWLPLLSLYLTKLGFDGIKIAWIQNTFAIGSVFAMFVGGQLADRYFATEKFLALSHFVGGVTMLLLPWQKDFYLFFAIMLVHCLFYVPTLSMTNSMCFANLKDPQKDFGFVRLWGTIGWIAVSWPFVFLLIDWKSLPEFGTVTFTQWLGKALGTAKQGTELQNALTWIFFVAGGASIVLSLFCLTLPHTPPAKNASSKNAPLEAIKLLKNPSILVLFIVTFIDAVVLYCYFFWTSPFMSTIGIPENWIMPAMSIGQIAEILTMAVLGVFLKKLGWKKTMLIGVFGQALRFFIYSVSGPNQAWLVILSNLIHGLCYAFFFATVYIFVDDHFPKDARTSAQGLFNFLIVGMGPLVGNFLWGALGNVMKSGDKIMFGKLFVVPTVLSMLAFFILLFAFHAEQPKKN
jgi:nucleoside transporter